MEYNSYCSNKISSCRFYSLASFIPGGASINDRSGKDRMNAPAAGDSFAWEEKEWLDRLLFGGRNETNDELVSTAAECKTPLPSAGSGSVPRLDEDSGD